MIGLANKESGYDLADQQDVESLSVSFVEALMRKRAEEWDRDEIRHRFRYNFDRQLDRERIAGWESTECNPARRGVFSSHGVK